MNANGAGAGTYLVSHVGDVIKRSVRLAILATNNLAKYEALLVGLDAALTLGFTLPCVLSDSTPSGDSLIASQPSEQKYSLQTQLRAASNTHTTS